MNFGYPYGIDESLAPERDLTFLASAPDVALRCLIRNRIGKALESPASFPERGPYPAELLALGIRDYRQTCFKPYRMIYRVAGKRVYVYLIVDGRRDMQSLLARRLLRAWSRTRRRCKAGGDHGQI